jgi:hypothetical protein
MPATVASVTAIMISKGIIFGIGMVTSSSGIIKKMFSVCGIKAIISSWSYSLGVLVRRAGYAAAPSPML